MIWYLYILWKWSLQWVWLTSINAQLQLFFLVGRTFKVFLYNFQMYSTIFFTIVTMVTLYTQDLFYSWKVGPFDYLYPFCPSYLLITTDLFSVSVSEFFLGDVGGVVCLFFRFHMWDQRYLFFSDLLYLAYCPQGSIHVVKLQNFPSFLWLNNIPLYIFLLPVYPLMDT